MSSSMEQWGTRLFKSETVQLSGIFQLTLQWETKANSKVSSSVVDLFDMCDQSLAVFRIENPILFEGNPSLFIHVSKECFKSLSSIML